jgi:hypothetical protein
LVSGQIAAEVLDGDLPSIDRLELVSPDRYSGLSRRG